MVTLHSITPSNWLILHQQANLRIQQANSKPSVGHLVVPSILFISSMKCHISGAYCNKQVACNDSFRTIFFSDSGISENFCLKASVKTWIIFHRTHKQLLPIILFQIEASLCSRPLLEKVFKRYNKFIENDITCHF